VHASRVYRYRWTVSGNNAGACRLIRLSLITLSVSLLELVSADICEQRIYILTAYSEYGNDGRYCVLFTRDTKTKTMQTTALLTTTIVVSPMLKYKSIFQIKYTETILSNSTRKLLWFEITIMLIVV